MKARIRKEYSSMLEDFQMIEFKKLDTYCKAASQNMSYVLVLDSTENNDCYSYFSHKSTLANFGKNLKRTQEEVLEETLKNLVDSMRQGGNFVINLNDAVHWKEAVPESLPSELWNYDEWRKPENHLKIVREDEDDSKFALVDSFNLVVLARYPKDEFAFVELVKSIPNWDEFSLYIVKDMTQDDLRAADEKRKEKGKLDPSFGQDANQFRNFSAGQHNYTGDADAMMARKGDL